MVYPVGCQGREWSIRAPNQWAQCHMPTAAASSCIRESDLRLWPGADKKCQDWTFSAGGQQLQEGEKAHLYIPFISFKREGQRATRIPGSEATTMQRMRPWEGLGLCLWPTSSAGCQSGASTATSANGLWKLSALSGHACLHSCEQSDRVTLGHLPRRQQARCSGPSP